MSIQNNSSINRGNKGSSLSLDSQGPTSLRQRVCCYLLRQIAPMKDVAVLETPQENVVNLWLSLTGCLLAQNRT